MSESGACLALTEKRPQSQRPGGCVGIFFQLLDWNRRFAKKKLFSKKLLAPARAMKAAKSFGGDEKMPKGKLHLIADENSVGFPNVKKNGVCRVDSDSRHEMKSPSLVARLMGLESMPAASLEKPKKDLLPESVDDDGKMSYVGTRNVEGAMRLESRPQKLQKTGECEKQAVVRFGGAEAFQIKNVLSRSSRKNHHSKLASPVKSPRVSSGRNVSRTRLIDVATKILEPGLQSTNRAKCLLTYPSSMHFPTKERVMEELTRVRSPEPFHQPCYNANEGKSLTSQTSCKNCGESLDAMDLRSYDRQCDFPSSSPNFSKYSCEGSGMTKQRPPASFPEREKDVILEKTQDCHRVGQEGLLAPSKPHKDETCTVFKSRTQAQNLTSFGRDRVPSRAKSSNLQSRRVSVAANSANEPKDFVSLNRNLSGRTRPRVENSNVGNQKKSCDIRNDSLPSLRSTVRKRRTVNERVERSKLENGRNFQPDAFPQRKMAIDSRAGSNRANGSKDGDIISFSFDSPIRNKTGPTGTATQTSEKRRDQNFNGITHFQEPLPLHGDALSDLLERKLKELTSQEEDELNTGTSLPKRSTAIILQELIIALNTEQPVSHHFQQENSENERTARSMHDDDHLSPGSVLEASFSNDSCFSSSIDENYGPKVPVDLSDSATSWKKECTKTATHLQTMNHAREVIFKAELLLGNAVSADLLDEWERFVHFTRPHYVRSLCLENKKGGVLRRFLFESMIECLESRYGRFGSTKLPEGVSERALVHEIDEDVKKWTVMAGKATDEMAEWEMSHGLGKWNDFGAEGFETGEEIDGYILEHLVEEIVIDL